MDRIYDVSNSLEGMSKHHSSETAEFVALKLGAAAYVYASTFHKKDFAKFVALLDSGLSEEQIIQLKSMGIDPSSEV